MAGLAIIGGLAAALTWRAAREGALSDERQRLLGEVERRAAVLDARTDMARIEVQEAEGRPAVAADPDCLQRILGNLLSNALKYSDPGTPVTARTLTGSSFHAVLPSACRWRGAA